MEQIQNEEALSALLWNQLKPGVATNAPWRPDAYLHEIQAGRLYAHVWSGGLLLLQQRNGFQRLRFFLQPGGSLPDWRPEPLWQPPNRLGSAMAFRFCFPACG